MRPEEAYRLLELPPEATPAEIETRFRALRARLEDKIAKAPTDGLKTKYRESLAEISEAHATLMAAADTTALPVLRRGAGDRRPEAGDRKVGTDPGASLPRPSAASPARKSGGREFWVVALIGVAVLGAGGWWVVKTRAEKAEQARVAAAQKAEAERIAAEQKAEAERRTEETRLAAESKRQAEEEEKARQAAAEKTERERVEKLLVSLRTQLAELRLQWELMERAEREAERAASEAKSDLRSLRDAPQGRQTELTARAESRDDFYRWLSEHLARHPVRALRARAEEYLSAKAVDEAAAVVAELAAELPKLDEDVRREREARLAITGRLELASEPAGIEWSLEDAFGQKLSGRTPATLVDLGRGPVQVLFRRQGWTDQRRTVEISPRRPASVRADFVPGSLLVQSVPSGAEVLIAGKVVGQTPYRITELVPGPSDLEVRLKGYKSATLRGTIEPARELAHRVNLEKIPGPEFGRSYTIEDLNLTLVPLAPGVFQMGSASGGAGDERPVTQVTLTKPFWLGKTEVTNAQWRTVMGYVAGLGDDLPASMVGWNEAMQFCQWLTEREREKGRLPEGYVYTLPTEAQWEYACRAGTTGDHAGNLDNLGWYAKNSGANKPSVGRKQPNAWGLHDMHGNVNEWCLDWFGKYPGGNVSDPVGPTAGSYRIMRGGSWDLRASDCRSSWRAWSPPDKRAHNVGFRVALAPKP